jgi:hypothetical protein
MTWRNTVHQRALVARTVTEATTFGGPYVE